MSLKYKYLFPFEKIPQGSHIVIYGAGDVGQEYLQQLQITGYCDVEAFIDRAYNKYPSMIIPVYPLEKVKELSFDYIVLAFKMGAHVHTVTKKLISLGIGAEKIVYTEPREEVEVLAPYEGEFEDKKYSFAYLQDCISIALKYGPGLGDAIVKKKFFTELTNMAPDCKIDIYSPGAGEIIKSLYCDLPNLNAVIDDGGALYAKHRSYYDLAFTVSFMLDMDVFNNDRLTSIAPDFSEKMSRMQKSCKKYNLSATGVIQRFVHFHRMKFLGLDYYTYLNSTGVFDIKNHKVNIPLSLSYEEEYKRLNLLGKYITVNFGSGVDASNKYNQSAKEWPFVHMERFVEMFKKKYPDIGIVQVGSKETLKISGVDFYVIGESLDLVKYVLKGGILHVDKEGGLVHLATQLGTKCIVCFGPTQIDYFGYVENINIQSRNCHGCYCLYDGFDVCAKGMEKPECMWGITPDMVMEKVDIVMSKPLVIFGYAGVGKKIYEIEKKKNPGLDIIFCDNASIKQGVHDGVRVLSLQQAVKEFGNAKYIIASLRHNKQMKQQLLSVGIPLEQIIVDLPDQIVGEELAKEQKHRLTPLDSIHVEVNINKDCNLNCKGCDHFAPIAEADTLELDIFESDMKRIAEIMMEHIHRIILLGGEPLLNAQLLEYVKIARRYMPKTEVFIATNGILLDKMGEEFWNVLKETNTGLMVTKYPVKVDYDKIQKVAESRGVVWEYLGSSESGRSLWHFPLDLSGSQDPIDSFIHCANANSCHTLERGKLYTCSIAPHAKIFNKYFSKSVPLKYGDGIDIYKARSADEILRFLATPINFCRYCNVKGRTYDNGWEVSKKDIGEWTCNSKGTE